ncbi:MAG: polyphosphate:AMP phosphotransferase [Candidatus Riflebacteria bacterium]
MLEMVDLDKKLNKEEYKTKMADLERRLSDLQQKTRQLGIATVLVFEGLEAAGKGTLINQLLMPLDPRGFKVHPIQPPTREEAMFPFLLRYWKKLPEKGRLAIFDKSWYEKVLDERVTEKIPGKKCQKAFNEILAFERQQADSGVVMIKFWVHISKKEQGKRFKEIQKNSSLAWKIGKDEIKQHKAYDKYIEAAEEILEKTGNSQAQWIIVEAHDRRYAANKVFETLAQTWEEAIANREKEIKQLDAVKKKISKKDKKSPINVTVLSNLDLTQSLSREEYQDELKFYQKRIRELEHEIYVRRIPAVIVYEGVDAAGKGGNIKRLTENLDPRGYEVIPIAAPTKEELARHYLWRFAREMPKAGHLTIFDRSWYGRVLVERVEGFCSEKDWQRAYREINEFEAHLADFGAVIVKFWLHIDQDEQLKRFKERENTPWKTWKITEEDWRNRDKWPTYEAAINDMLVKCSTSYAPWTIIEANDKYFARVKALKTVVNALEDALEKS